MFSFDILNRERPNKFYLLNDSLRGFGASWQALVNEIITFWFPENAGIS